MADKARKGYPDGPVVFSYQNDLRRDIPYFCYTDGCSVKMTIVANGEAQCHFRSENHANHISVKCTRNNIIFNPDHYTGDGFELDSFKRYALGIKDPTNIHKRKDDTTTGKVRTVGHNHPINPHTLKQLYFCLISHDLSNSFGNIPHIGDVLICRDNAIRYTRGFTGTKICEFTFYRYNDVEKSIYVNIPTFKNTYKIVARLLFDNDNLFYKIKSHFLNIPKNKRHLELAVVIGDWTVLDDTDIRVECHIRSQNQITYVE